MLARFFSMRMLLALCAMLMALAGEAGACAICFSGTVFTPGQRLDSSEQAVLAVPAPGKDRFVVVASVKGDVAVDDVIAASDVAFPKTDLVMSLDGQTEGKARPTVSDTQPMLLVRNRRADGWSFVGSLGAEYAPWLRQLAATRHAGGSQPARLWPAKVMAWSYLSDAEWRERMAVVGPQLESAEPFVAEIAYGEVMRAPYGAMRTLLPGLDAARVRGWIDDPALASRRAVYLLLLGIAGGEEDAARLERLIDASLSSGDTENLAALLAADLELRGPSRVDWLEATYFADRSRTLPEIDAALLALSVHGQADGDVPRARVVDAYRHFIDIRKPMAGFVAQELADWQAWDATADYVEIIRSNAVKDPAGQFAIMSYLKSSPLTAGQNAPAAQ